MRNFLIKLLGGYTKEEVFKVGDRKFYDYAEMRRLGGFLPKGAELELLAEGIAGKFAIRQYDGDDNNCTTIKTN